MALGSQRFLLGEAISRHGGRLLPFAALRAGTSFAVTGRCGRLLRQAKIAFLAVTSDFDKNMRRDHLPLDKPSKRTYLLL
jgi:hypothetical protein